jgi:hypothetical protein
MDQTAPRVKGVTVRGQRGFDDLLPGLKTTGSSWGSVRSGLDLFTDEPKRFAPDFVRRKWADTAPTVVASGTPANDVLRT